jgi:hypothetical protein
MGEITHFIAMAFDLTDHGLVAGEPSEVSQPRSGDRASQGLMESVRPYRGCDIRPYRLFRIQNDRASNVRQRAGCFHRLNKPQAKMSPEL